MPEPSSLTAQAHCVLDKKLCAEDIVIDATAGNGHDTLFLAQRVKQVFAFDIQPQAIEATRQRLEQANLLEKVSLLQQGHQFMSDVIPGRFHGHIHSIMFNLGYLPGGDKQRITRAETTLEALNSGLGLLQKHGIITLLVYPGHPGGEVEKKAIESWLSDLSPANYAINTRYSNHQRPGSPILHIIHNVSDQ